MAEYFFNSALCQSWEHCAICRSRGEKGRQWRTEIAQKYDTGGQVDFECPFKAPWDFDPSTVPTDPVVEERPTPTVKQAATLAEAMLSGKYVAPEIVEERIATCRACEHKRVNDRGVEWCGVCGCKVSAASRELTNLVSYEENLPKWGCKHPKRKEGKGWKR